MLENLNMIYLKLKFIASEILEKYNKLNCKNQPNDAINLIYHLKAIVTQMDSYLISDDPDMYLEAAACHLEECRRMLKYFTDLGNSNENDMNNNSSVIECSEVDNVVSQSSETDITITQNAAMDVVPQISMDHANCNTVVSQSPPLEFVSFPQSNKLSSLTSSDQTTKNSRIFEVKPEISISESAVAISKVPENTGTNVFQEATVSEISSKSQIPVFENMQLDENKKADSNEFSKDKTHYQHVDKDAFIEYTALLQFAETWKNLYQTFVNDPKWKKAKGDLQKAVNTPINSTSDVSAKHLHDKMKRLETFLSGHNIVVTGKTVCINVCSEGKYFCLDFIAKKIVGQGESQISSRPEAAFPLAALTVFLCQKYPDLLKLFLAHLYKSCPYLVPYYIPYQGQNEDDYLKQLGYVYYEGVVETQAMFLKRMSGIVCLYAAVIVTLPILNNPHPHGMKHAWIWLARLLNLQPRSDITATILVDFLEVAGYAMQKTYGKQFQKLMEALAIEFLPKVKKATLPGSGGPLQRLEYFLEEYFKEGTIPKPSGILDSTFWKIS
ncbi:mRNA export factor GLE1-like [Centruroides vittatus]|uniref:mRNA export factor GLE1-like n=1 Tax=Centruroides vittatus TaxID=120091 RepID=UPI00350FB510